MIDNLFMWTQVTYNYVYNNSSGERFSTTQAGETGNRTNMRLIFMQI